MLQRCCICKFKKHLITRKIYHLLHQQSQQICSNILDVGTIQHVVKSTLAAEILALEEALEECCMIRLILLEIYNK